MILDEFVKINFSSNKYKYFYENLGYIIDKSNKLIVKVCDLPNWSTAHINVECDKCKNKKYIRYSDYYKNYINCNYYACSHKCSVDKLKQKWLNKDTEEINNINEKKKLTCLKNFDTEFPFQNKEIQEKSKQTCLKKYNCENPAQNDKIKEKMKQTNLTQYGVEYALQSKEIREKAKNTNLEKYGFEFSACNDNIKEKNIKTNLKKYGVKYASQSDIVKNKIKETNLKNCGFECNLNNPENIKKVKETNLKLYSVEYPLQNKEIQEKLKQTCLKNYGVKHHQQNIEVFNKTQKNAFKAKHYKETNIYYRGTYEKDFLDLCFDKNIKVENCKSFKYLFENKEKIYFPDFYLPYFNLIIEIKSDYYYNKYLEKNLVKKQTILENKYNFLFIINKNYDEFLKLVNN